MKKICMLLFMQLFFNALVLADDVDVVVEPKEAVINESFFVTFKIKTSDSEEPYISFTPYGASVLGKRSQGLSISTVVINGKFTTTKEQAVVYELQADRPGQAYLRNIKIELGGKTINLKEVRITILNEARRVPDAFMEAEASKTKVYLGEGIDVNYYLYFKQTTNASDVDVKEFPKLNKFIKRFHHINAPVEVVQYKGQVLRRLLAYSARLYPEKVGPAVLDPMKISVKVIETEGSPFGGFGFGSQRVKAKDLSSPRIEIEVLPLPAEGVPASFTGLIGEHDFILTVPKNKYVVNEPIELKLEVRGKGALENLDAPLIYTDNNLEQFDTKSEVSELGVQAAKKIFEYTLLARGPVSLPAREMALAYFDPATGKYVEKKIAIPALEVAGVAMSGQSSGGSSSTINSKSEESDKSSVLDSIFKNKEQVEKNQLGLVAPVYQGQARWFDNGFLFLNYILLLLIFFVTGHWVYVLRKGVTSSTNTSFKQDIARMRKKGLMYSELYKVLSSLDKNNKMSAGGISIINVLDDSSLSKEAKSYFKDALAFTERGTFANTSNSSGGKKMNFEAKYFNELMKHL